MTLPDGRVVSRQVLPPRLVRGVLGVDAMGPARLPFLNDTNSHSGWFARSAWKNPADYERVMEAVRAGRIPGLRPQDYGIRQHIMKSPSASPSVSSRSGTVSPSATNLPAQPAANSHPQPVTRAAPANMDGRALAAAAFVKSGYFDYDEMRQLMGQLEGESRFHPKSEDLRYSPGRFSEVFRVPLEKATEIVRQGPEAIANFAYASKNGNKEPGDGYRYRGRGYVQLTGRANYQEMGNAIGVDLVSNPELANEPYLAARIAAEYYRTKRDKYGKDLRSAAGATRATGPRMGHKATQDRSNFANKYDRDTIDRLAHSASK
jgi:predicted chitinase